MKQTKRILSVALCLVMVLCAVPVMNVGASTSTPYYNWKQYDSQWSGNYIGTKTIGAIGCAATSVAMLIVQAGFRNESNFDPGTFVSEMKEIGGFSNNDIYWGKVSSIPGCSDFTYVDNYSLPGTTSGNVSAIKAKVDAGYSVVVSVKGGEHYVAVRSASSGSVTMMDPGSTNTDLYGYYSASNSTKMFVYEGKASTQARIDINPQGGTAQDSFYVNYGEKCNLTIDSAWKPGYHLAGWNLYRPADGKWFCSGEGWCTPSEISANGYTKQQYSANLSMTLDESWYRKCDTSVSVFTFFAVWKEATYTVNINANSGTATTTSLSLKYNTTCNLSSNYVYRNGYELAGWNLYRPADAKWFVGGVGWCTASEISANGYTKQQYIPNLSMNLGSSWFTGCSTSVYMFTFVAVWKEGTYAVNINANGGTATTSSLSVKYNTKCNLSPSFVQRPGYQLAGWNLYRPADSKWWASGVGWCTASEISTNGYNKKIYTSNLSMMLDDSWFRNCNAAVSSFTFYAVWTTCAHTWNSGTVTKAATCSATGTKTYTCTVCGATKTETVAINSNHVNTTNVAATASTCTVKGYTAGVYCNDCKKYISGHAEQPLAAHKTELRNQKNADCTTAGYTGDQYCTVCKQTITKGSATAALGHTAPDGNGNCTRCGKHIKDVTPTQPTQPSQPQTNPNACKYCGQVHTGFFGKIVGFFHSILAFFK